MKACICVEMLHEELPYEERIAAVASAGFGAVEFWSWQDKDIPAIAAAARSAGVRVANFSGHREGDLLDPAQRGLVAADFDSAMEARALLDCPNLMLLAQSLGAGGRVLRPRPEEAGPSEIAAMAACVRTLLGRIPAGVEVSLCIESLNTALDHPGYAVSKLSTAAALVSELGDPRFGLLLDFYHQAMMGDDLLSLVAGYARIVKHVHVADAPGRHEPGTGAIDWHAVLSALGEAGYEGYVGFECSPSASSEAALEAIARLWRGL